MEEEDDTQKMRTLYCDLLDVVNAAPNRVRRHLLWWFAKEALYHLGVVNGDIDTGPEDKWSGG